jgi:predicted ATP-grasp superfamily ATP-dependent carboligase
MIDLKYRGANDLEVIIHKLRNYADDLENKIKEQEELIKKLKEQIKDQIKSSN